MVGMGVVVKTLQGELCGSVADGVYAFLGVPYAAVHLARIGSCRLVAPVISEGPYSYKEVNVLAQRRDALSLLTWFERMLHTRRECEEISVGEREVVDGRIPGVLVHRATGARGTMLFVHNLCRHHRRITLEPQPGEDHRPLNVAADGEYDEDINLLCLEINGYGCRWLRLNHTPWI